MTTRRFIRPDAPAELPPPELEFTAGPAAGWLPRVLAAVFAVAALIVARRLDPARGLLFGEGLRLTVIVVGAALALGALRWGGEAALRVGFEGARLTLRRGDRFESIRLEDLERLEYEYPFGATRGMFPALVLRDRSGRRTRVPNLLRGGAELVRQLVKRSDREDLRAWSDSLALERRMGRAGLVVGLGYAIAAATLVAAIGFYAR